MTSKLKKYDSGTVESCLSLGYKCEIQPESCGNPGVPKVESYGKRERYRGAVTNGTNLFQNTLSRLNLTGVHRNKGTDEQPKDTFVVHCILVLPVQNPLSQRYTVGISAAADDGIAGAGNTEALTAKLGDELAPQSCLRHTVVKSASAL